MDVSESAVNGENGGTGTSDAENGAAGTGDGVAANAEAVDGEAAAAGAGEEATVDGRGDGSDGQVSVGLALSAGGAVAEAWHSGVVQALAEATGWDARGAELILGTSAGAITGLCLRTGLSPADLYARQQGEPMSTDGQALLDRVVTPYAEGCNDRDWTERGPQSPTLAARALWPPWEARPLHAVVGLLPRGARTTESLEQRLSEMHPEVWPQRRFWVPAVRLSDGERVVFGRDDVQVSAALAVRASCAVPVRYEPVTVDGHRYVDGGVHSYSNADLLGPPAFDVVVVSSVMSGSAGWPKVRGALSQAWTTALGGLGRSAGRAEAPDRTWLSEALDQAWCDGRAFRAARRQWVDDKLRAEIDSLRRRGVAVLVVDPDADGVELIDSATDDNVGRDIERDDTEADDGDGGSGERRRSRRADVAEREPMNGGPFAFDAAAGAAATTDPSVNP